MKNTIIFSFILSILFLPNISFAIEYDYVDQVEVSKIEYSP